MDRNPRIAARLPSMRGSFIVLSVDTNGSIDIQKITKRAASFESEARATVTPPGSLQQR